MSSKSAIVVVLAFFLVGSPIMLVSAQPPPFHVPVLRNPVTLDGVITGAEWADAHRMDVTFTNDSLRYPGTIYLKHNCTHLWMCIQVQDDDEEPSPGPGEMGDLVGIIFGAGSSRDMALLLHNDLAMDCAMMDGATPVVQNDEAIGGVNNVAGASNWVAGTYTFELIKPLNSGDSAGRDIALSSGDEIDAIFMYNDAGETIQGPVYIGYILSLEVCRSVGGIILQSHEIGPLAALSASLTATLAILSTIIIIYKRRETQSR
jgi:hypothetical protein